MEPRPPNSSNASNPLTPPMAEAVADAGSTASGPHTAGGDGAPAVPPVPPPPDPKVGDVVGPYKLLGTLGKGGMATVYLAEEIALRRQVALKILSPATALSDPLAKPRFIREAQAQAAVEHDHIAIIHAVGEAGGISFIAMPVLKGQTLALALHQKPQPSVAELVRVAREIAEGLAAAHAKKLVHRDIKPSNVWLEGEKTRVRILDFGLAREITVTEKELTIVGKVVGTPAYMSPEQAKGKPVDHRTDLFSLGVVMYQMATGQKPFTGDTSFEIMAAITTDEPFPVADLAPNLPPKLAALINQLLAKEPKGRPASAAHVVAELKAIEAGLVPQVAVPVLPAAVAEPVVPNPFAGMDSTEKEKTAPVAKSGRHAKLEDRRPARRDEEDENEDDDAPARPGKSVNWVWVGAGVLGAALVVGLVWLAIAALSPKKETVEKKDKEPPKVNPNPNPQPKPKDKEPPPPPPENDRAAAEVFVKNAKVKVLLDGGPEELLVPARGVIPPGKRVTITEIDFDDEVLEPKYVTSTFLPHVAELKSLQEVRMLRWQLRLNAAQIGLLAAKPVAKTLERLDARVELTPESLDALKKFPKLIDITVSVPEASDELFKRLAKDMPELKLLTLFSVADRDELTDEGWKVLAKMKKMAWITLVRCPAGAKAFRVLTAKGATDKPGSAIFDFQVCDTIDDDALLGLSQRGTDVKTLCLRSVNVTDKGLEHLAKVPSLKKLTLNQTNVTDKGVKALREARGGALEVTWDGKPFEPEK